MAESKHLRICPLCEATCQLQITTDNGNVSRVEGDIDDPFSEGYICPKGAALKDLHHDPDRLSAPMIKDGDTHREATWDEAFALIEEKLNAIMSEHGRQAVGVYLGNPNVHNLSLSIYGQAFLKTLRTPNIFTATSVDQLPKHFISGFMFGHPLSIPVPDINRADYLLILGANPLVSNGSLMTAPNVGERLKRIQQRGGKIVVVDPRRSKTAKMADEHHFIRPGMDALFLLAIAHTIVQEELDNPGHLTEHVNGLDEIKDIIKDYSPEKVANTSGIDAGAIRRIARELAAAESAAVYGRIGTCTQPFGTLASWLPEVIHVLTGNLDRPGGAMFTKPAHGPANTKGEPGKGGGFKIGRRKSRVSGRPEILGEFPVSVLAEEIETPGAGQIRAMFTVAGNPVLSTPNSERLDKAFANLDFMVSVDVYLNETTRHADVILPGLSPLYMPHYDLAFANLAIHNYARYSPPVYPNPESRLDEWEILLRLVGILSGAGANADPAMMDQMVATTLIQREMKSDQSPIHNRDADEILSELGPTPGPERILDFMLRTGPYGDGFGANSGGITLAKLKDHPRGVDLGPLEPRIPELLRTPSGKIELTPIEITADLPRLEAVLKETSPKFVLVGRRSLRTNNSWMHNLERLVKGNNRCTLHVHPDDAKKLGLEDGGLATITSKAGTVEAPVEITDDIMPGVVSLPHGWGHDAPGAKLDVAREHAGVNSNILTDETALDEPSGNAVLSGIPVTVKVAEQAIAK